MGNNSYFLNSSSSSPPSPYELNTPSQSSHTDIRDDDQSPFSPMSMQSEEESDEENMEENGEENGEDESSGSLSEETDNTHSQSESGDSTVSDYELQN